jgi:hypothetical protein
MGIGAHAPTSQDEAEGPLKCETDRLLQTYRKVATTVKKVQAYNRTGSDIHESIRAVREQKGGIELSKHGGPIFI